MACWWLIRAGVRAVNVSRFLSLGIVGMSGRALGPLSDSLVHGELERRYAQAFPGESPSTRILRVRQFFLFASSIHIDDTVVTAGPGSGDYYIGKVLSCYEWNETLLSDTPHIRRVRWSSRVSRSELRQESIHSLGSINALFQVSGDVAADLARNSVPLVSQGDSA
jgi:predicted Mrr-cat superfamily restriction endonuclease